MTEKFITVKEVQAQTGKAERTVRLWLAKGLLPTYHVGPRDVRVKQSDLDNLLRPVLAGE